MIEEILYTSAPKGLKHGSRGFCTVVSTAGMGANLAERLESMSGYRHAFPLNDPRVSQNPVNYCHVATRLAGKRLNVISRVADAGQDYTGRTNKLAHHIVIDDVSQYVAGPARLAESGDCFATAWSGQLENRAPRIIGSPSIPKRIPLTHWKSVTGDGGWAGYVAEQIMASQQPIYVIFAPGTDTLSLVREVLDLLPISERWKTTFSTYFVKLLAGTECQLRFILHDTAEATAIRNNARAITVDLTAKLPPAEGGKLVETARAGELASQAAAPIVANPVNVPTIDVAGADDHAVPAESRKRKGLRPPKDSRTASAVQPPMVAADRSQFSFERRRGLSPAMWGVIGTLLIGIAIGLFFVLREPIGRMIEAKENKAVAQQDGERKRQEGQNSIAETGDSVQPPEANVSTEVAAVAPVKVEMDEPEPEPDLVDPFEGSKPFKELRKKLAAREKFHIWNLPSSKAEKASEAYEVYLREGDKFSVAIKDGESSRLTSPAGAGNLEIVSDGNENKFSVNIDGTNLGWFELNRSNNTPSKINWYWAKGISKQRPDLSSAQSEGMRRLRAASIEFGVRKGELETAIDDQLAVQITEQGWTPFGYERTQSYSNLNSEDRIYLPGPSSGGGKKPTGYLFESDDSKSVSLAVVARYSEYVAGYSVETTEVKPSNKSRKSWSIALRNENGVDPIGRYNLHRKDGCLCALTFEFSKGKRSSDQQIVVWAPVVLSANGHSTVLFPSASEVTPSVPLKNLVQSNTQEFPLRKSLTKMNIPLDLRHDGGTVNVICRLSPAAQANGDGSPRSNASWETIESEVKLTWKEPTNSSPGEWTPNGQTLSGIGLRRQESPLFFREEARSKERKPWLGLGTLKLQVNSQSTNPDANSIGLFPVQIEATVRYNKLSYKDATELSPVKLSAEKYWVEETDKNENKNKDKESKPKKFNRGTAKAAVDELVQKLKEQAVSVSYELRDDESSAVKLTSMETLKKTMANVSNALNGKKQSLIDKRDKPIDELKKQFPNTESSIDYVRKNHRDLFDDQIAAYEKLAEGYEPKVFEQEVRDLRRLKEEIARVRLGMDVYVDLSSKIDRQSSGDNNRDKDGPRLSQPIHLYLMTTSEGDQK